MSIHGLAAPVYFFALYSQGPFAMWQYGQQPDNPGVDPNEKPVRRDVSQGWVVGIAAVILLVCYVLLTWSSQVQQSSIGLQLPG